MWDYINETLMDFKKCFTRQTTFKWFAIIVIGFMTWHEHTGVTSFVRELWINPSRYEAMLHFFRSNAWNLSALKEHWFQIVIRLPELIKENAMPILVGDGTKEGKEGRKMPCVKKHHQESENSSKASYIFGHMFGGIGVLIGNVEKMYCLPLSVTLHDGNKQIRKWLEEDSADESHVVRIISEACALAKAFIPSILLLDRYFLTVPALEMLETQTLAAGRALLTVITKAKRNAAAYKYPVKKPGRGRPRKKGEPVKLMRLFTTDADQFTQASVRAYGKREQITYLCRDYLWGKGLYKELRFVLVNWFGTQSILVCTNLAFTPEQIIRLYSYRFKIECCFREMKQTVSGFSYRFWSKLMPRLNRYAKSGTDPLESVKGKKQQERITAAYKATQGFVMLSCIAMGLLQISALRFFDTIYRSPLRWLRTKTNPYPSEATVADFMRKSIFLMFQKRNDLDVIRFIQSEQDVMIEKTSSRVA
jgi:hypothetical protein